MIIDIWRAAAKEMPAVTMLEGHASEGWTETVLLQSLVGPVAKVGGLEFAAPR